MCLRAPDRSYRVEVTVDRIDSEQTTAGLLLFFNHRLFLGLEVTSNCVQAWAGGTRTWSSEPLPDGTRVLELAIEKREDVVDMYFRVPGQEDWQHYPLTLECSGYHANTVNDLVSLRPALFASGAGRARFTSFRYHAL